LEEAIEKAPERYQGILESFCEGPRSLVTWFATERSILEVFLNFFARFELLQAYSEVIREIYGLYQDSEKRESYLEGVCQVFCVNPLGISYYGYPPILSSK
jgi:hypothetical protein